MRLSKLVLNEDFDRSVQCSVEKWVARVFLRTIKYQIEYHSKIFGLYFVVSYHLFEVYQNLHLFDQMRSLNV